MEIIPKLGACALSLLGAGLLCSLALQAAEPVPAVSAMPAANISTIQVPIYKSRVLTTRAAVKKVSVGNPEIADILVTSPTQLYLLGRSLGSTNVLLWDGRNRLIDSLDLEVIHDLSGLKSKLHELLPNERIEVYSAQGALVLRGQVSSAAAVDTEVKLAKMQRSLVKRLGVCFLGIGSAGNWSLGGFNDSASLAETLLSSDKGFLAQFTSGSFLFDAVLEAAKENGSAKVLAEPTLTTLTGQQAEFISGGEFPVPVSDDDGITIEYKEFGVGVKFLPVVLDSGRINLNLNVSVSELVAANSLVVNTEDAVGASLLVPALTKRSAQSTVELGNGQTIAIAGLISENTRDFVSRFPGLGDIAVLGHLFRSQEFINGETELVILVTPHLAKPLDARSVRLPTEKVVAPGDMDFYLLGRTKGRDMGRPVPVSLGVSEGSFGHDLQ